MLANFVCLHKKTCLVLARVLFKGKLQIAFATSAQRVVYQYGLTLELPQPQSPTLGDLSFNTLAHGRAQATLDLQCAPESV